MLNSITDLIAIFIDQTLLIAILISIFCAIIQGYSGFGGGLIFVPLVASLYNPIDAILISCVGALITHSFLIPSTIKEINKIECLTMSLGVLITIPLGLLFLIAADPKLIMRGMGLFVLISGILFLKGWNYSGPKNYKVSVIAGALSGLFLGGLGIPTGPIMVIYLMSGKEPIKIKRANIIVIVLITVAAFIVTLAFHNQISTQALFLSLVLTPAFILGSFIGKYFFERFPISWFKNCVNFLLILTGLAFIAI